MHNSNAFDVILEKHCIKFLWMMFNSKYDLFRTIIKYSLYNGNTTLGENVRYFMHNYNIVFTECFDNINTLYKKINIYVKNKFDAECYYVGTITLKNCVKHVTMAAHNSWNVVTYCK